MKKSAIKKIEKEIDEKTKLPYEIKNKIRSEIFTNITIASVIIVYFIFIILGSIGIIKNLRPIDLNVFSFLFLTIAIVLFEVAYRKSNGSLAIYGIEFLVVAIFTLFMPYIIFELDDSHKKIYLLASVFIAIYYTLKSIYVSIRIKNEYLNSVSDVKEIVKKEKTKNSFNEEIEEVEEVEPTEKNKKEEAKPKKRKNAKKTEKEAVEKQTSEKRGKAKKTKKEEVIVEEQKPKKRGRPKKTEASENKQKESTTPKKRGRPRKVDVVK